MKIAVVGSKGLKVNDLGRYLPSGVTEIVSGGARGIDTCAREYAEKNRIKLTEFLPQYEKYGRSAPVNRNVQISDDADVVLALRDGKSKGTKYVIEQCKKQNKEIKIFFAK